MATRTGRFRFVAGTLSVAAALRSYESSAHSRQAAPTIHARQPGLSVRSCSVTAGRPIRCSLSVHSCRRYRHVSPTGELRPEGVKLLADTPGANYDEHGSAGFRCRSWGSRTGVCVD
jgi:hypothetical protein